MRKNSFKELEEIEFREISMRSDNIRNGIASDIGMMKYVTSVIDFIFQNYRSICVIGRWQSWCAG